MSFNVNWNTLETEQLREYTRDVLTSALNSGNPPKILAAPIEIKQLEFGKAAPEFEILEIGELDQDRFRGIFKVSYTGDFELTLHTRVNANPLHIHNATSLEREVGNDAPDIDLHRFVTPNFGIAKEAFPLPLDLKLSNIKISGIGIIVFSKTKGLTLVFRNDPLDSIRVTSTFDTVQVLAKFLQKQIENQIRELFRETLPTLMHKLSLKFLNLDTLNRDLLAVNPTITANPVVVPVQQISQNNLRKMLKLYRSRETLKFAIPKFKNVIQRSHLEKYSNHPTLLNSLITDYDRNLSVCAQPQQSTNGIPIDILINEDVNKTEDVLRAISKVQTTSYYASAKEAPPPRRRRIKLGGSKKQATEPDANSTIDDSTVIDSSSVAVSNASSVSTTLTDATTVDPIVQPRPLRVSAELYHDLMYPLEPSHQHQHHLDSPSIVSGVGIGNNYFNFTSSRQSQSPPVLVELKKASTPVTPAEPKTSPSTSNSKSKNYLDTSKFNNKLRREFASYSHGFNPSPVFDTPPPYQV
ncbi:hypothetical protein DIURU_000749 [Diutina rugosa]|uniref:Mitochondrial distribution and morphology protein 34 n=1 Tax=Diutina rugosa TaxID=5481 RepID=A0A642UX18_DIURU|nr:uncharacterized protein DIURU_000749 [Diutina rugosa]KAA8907065.1 hypothetical protein DIURU_000749 [Diutina rugosa]